MIGAVKVVIHRPLLGRVKRLTVIRDIDQWFAAILVEGQPGIVQSGEGEVGVDVGVSNVVALSDVTVVENPRFLDGSLEQIKTLQVRLSRKKRGLQKQGEGEALSGKGLEEGQEAEGRFCPQTLTRAGREEQPHRLRRLEDSEYGEEPQHRIGNNGRLLGETAPADRLQGGKARGAGDPRRPQGDVAEMLEVQADTQERPIGSGARMPELWTGHGQGRQRRKEHTAGGSGIGQCGGRTSTYPAKEDKQVWLMKQEARRLEAWVVH
jgi:hypothetical protein